MTPTEEIPTRIISLGRRILRVHPFWPWLGAELSCVLYLFVYDPLFVTPNIGNQAAFDFWFWGVGRVYTSVQILLFALTLLLFGKRYLYDGSHVFDQFNLKRAMRVWP